MTNALATLASMCKVNKGQAVTPIEMSIYEFPAYCHNIEIEADSLPWYRDIKNYLKDRVYLPNALKRLALNFFL